MLMKCNGLSLILAILLNAVGTVGATQQTILVLVNLKEERLQPAETTSEKISSNNVLGSLPPELSGRLVASQKTIALREGEILFERGEAGDGCYWLRRGVAAVSVVSANAEQRILAILGAGAIVGELAMIDGLPRSATVTAIRDCFFTFISRAAFNDLLSRHPELYSDIAMTLAARLRQSDEDMVASSFLTVRARVARALLVFARHLGEDVGAGRVRIRHKITQSDLAAMAGVARESVSRTLSGWHREKIFEGWGRSEYVVDQTRLKAEAGE
jgi:CRP/FNR family transcriptional regulator, cyclic AMP receptor protein